MTPVDNRQFGWAKVETGTFRLQRSVNEFEAEALTAILPGVALAELWQMLGSVENVLQVSAVLILISSLLGLATLLLASIRERKAEISVLRAIGAGLSPFYAYSDRSVAYCGGCYWVGYCQHDIVAQLEQRVAG